ncbi:hypothetical protein DFH07DRAFT_1066651 [Mycena maculata]|uniref:Uncharacterized protein n=1 Tax=Mycena maculata TaxID=230809 RepID=A0AAD7MQS5_9AGAR|nr:hypothetical protein DFH07DRAFT_1066651 [Mycena maculata]
MVAKADIGTALRLAVVVTHASETAQIQKTRAILAHHIRAWQPHHTNLKNKKKDPLAHVHRFIRTIPLSPVSFSSRHVCRLHIGHLSKPELVTVPGACTGVAELGWWACTLSSPVAASLAALPLRRLAFDALPPPRPPLASHTSTSPSMRRPTSPFTPPLQHLRALTHLSAAFILPTSWAAPVFAACPALRVISGVTPHVVVMLPPVGDWTARWVHDALPLVEEVVRERRTIAAAEKAAAALDS